MEQVLPSNAWSDAELKANLNQLPPDKIEGIALELVLSDPVLSDIPRDKLGQLSEYDIDKLIAMHTGEAVQIFLRKYTGEKIRT